MTRHTDVHAFTARTPVGEYEGLKAFAFFTQTSINEVVLAAIRSHLQEQITGDRLNALVGRMRTNARTGEPLMARVKLPLDPLLRLYDGNVSLLAEVLHRPRRVVTRWKALGLSLARRTGVLSPSGATPSTFGPTGTR